MSPRTNPQDSFPAENHIFMFEVWSHLGRMVDEDQVPDATEFPEGFQGDDVDELHFVNPGPAPTNPGRLYEMAGSSSNGTGTMEQMTGHDFAPAGMVSEERHAEVRAERQRLLDSACQGWQRIAGAQGRVRGNAYFCIFQFPNGNSLLITVDYDRQGDVTVRNLAPGNRIFWGIEDLER